MLRELLTVADLLYFTLGFTFVLYPYGAATCWWVGSHFVVLLVTWVKIGFAGGVLS